MSESCTDTQIRNAAFAHVSQLMATRDQLRVLVDAIKQLEVRG
jgi:hypothetical protein